MGGGLSQQKRRKEGFLGIYPRRCLVKRKKLGQNTPAGAGLSDITIRELAKPDEGGEK